MQGDKWKDLGLRILFVALFLFAVTSNIQKIISNNKLNERVRQSKEDLAMLEAKSKKLELLSTYYQSTTYQEVEARRRLAMQKPDEKVVIIKGIPTDSTNNFETLSEPTENSNTKSQSNPARWWQYFFGNK